MAPTIMNSVLLVCVCLLLPHLGSSSYIRLSRHHHVVQSSHSSRASTQKQDCSSSIGIPTSGSGSGNRLPLVYRSSPCSPLKVSEKQGHHRALSMDDVFERDEQRLRAIRAARLSSSVADAVAPAPAPASGSGVTIPVAVTNDSSHGYRGLQYIVMVGYGTPAQPLPMSFETTIDNLVPAVSTLRCKPCSSGSAAAESCDQQAFDPARSSTFANVACGPDCPSQLCHGSACSLWLSYPNGTVEANGTFVKDTLALSPSATFPNFTVACMDVDNIHSYAGSAVGVLDLSRSEYSLVSRATSSRTGSAAAGFSYCLPASSTSDRGFLSIGGDLPLEPSAGSTPFLDIIKTSYIVKFARISVSGTELPTAAPAIDHAVLEVGTSFTYLKPAIYAALRDEFRKQMSQYTPAPPYDVLDTCYNFTRLSAIEIPAIWLEFDGGATLKPDVDQMMYFLDGDAIGCLAFAATPEGFPDSVIGNMVQQTVEVVYDLRERKVWFIPQSC